MHILGLGAASWRGLLGEILEDLRETAGGALGGRRSLNLLTPAADKSLDQKSDGCYHTRGPTHRLQPHETGPGGGGPPAHHHDPATGGGADTVQWAGPGAITWGPGAGAPHEQGPHEPV